MSASTTPLSRKIVILMLSTLTIMAGAIITAALPQIAVEFADTPGATILTKLVVSILGLAIGLTAPFSGWLVDRLKRLPVLFFSMVLYAVAGTSGLYLESLHGILLARAVLGIAVGAIMTTNNTLVGDYMQGAERNAFTGMQTAFATMGGVVFIIGGGYLAEISWRAPFAIYFFPLLLLPFAWLFLVEPDKSSGTEQPPAQPITKQPMVAQPDDETESAESTAFPMRDLAPIYLIGFIGMVFIFFVFIQLPFLFREASHISNTQIGFAVSLPIFWTSVVSLCFGRLKKRYRYEQIYLASFLVMGVGFIWLGYAGSFTESCFALSLIGLGNGLRIPTTILWVISASPMPVRGRAMGLLTSAFFFGQFFSPIVAEPLLQLTTLSSLFVFSGIAMICISPIFVLRTWTPHLD